MLIEQCAYANRWRSVSPAAKGLFALGGFVAAFAARQPAIASAVAVLITLATVLGARVALKRFIRVALPPLGFLLLGCLSLAYSLDFSDETRGLVMRWLPSGWSPVEQLAARSCGALAALLFLALTTPMIDLIALFRRLKFPEVLLEIMVLCYRMLFVFSEALHDTRTAQSARLGYATARLTLQIWQRAHALHIAAQSRNNDGAFRFLEPVYVNTRRDMVIAAAGGILLIVLSVVMA